MLVVKYERKNFFVYKRKTPKGDGNLLCSYGYYHIHGNLFIKEKPRKGTETLTELSLLYNSFPVYKRKTPKGDGNMIHMYLLYRFLWFIKEKPRKGTETFSPVSRYSA